MPAKKSIQTSQTRSAPEKQVQDASVVKMPSAKKATVKKAPKQAGQNFDAGVFFETGQSLLAVVAPDGQLVHVNPAFSSLFSVVKNQEGHGNFFDLISLKTRANIQALWDTSFGSSVPSQEPVTFTSGMDGSSGYADIDLHIGWTACMRGGMVYLSGENQTALKTQQDYLDAQSNRLSEAEAIGHMGHWRWIVGERALEWSEEIYNIFDLNRDVFVPTLDSIDRFLHRRDLGRMMQGFQRAILEKNDYEMEFRIVRPGGAIRHIRCQGRCELDHEGDVTALYGIMCDITEQALKERELRAARDQAERAYAAKSRFLANMSHELRTPLNAILGFSDMMKSEILGPIGNDKYVEYIEGIHNSGSHLLDLISDILDLSKIEAGKYDLDLEDFALDDVLRQSVQMIEWRAKQSDLTLNVDLQAGATRIYADPRAIKQIVLNLLSNAVKFTKPGGEVELSSFDRGHYILLRVRDNGIGIPANLLSQVTRPFEQVAGHDTRDHEGSGLGLAITKDLIDLHKGAMHIDSQLEQGTTVSIRLPKAPPASGTTLKEEKEDEAKYATG